MGGYLEGRACAGNSERVSACVPNPAQTSIAAIYANKFGQPFYGPLQYVAEHNASLLPAGYAAAFANWSTAILEPILLNCTETSPAPQALAETYIHGGKHAAVATIRAVSCCVMI